MQAEAAQLHREALEQRLVAEEMWSQLLGRMRPAEITQSSSRLYAKLAEHYRVESDRLTSQKQELTVLVERLTVQEERLQTQRREMHRWLRSRQQELSEQSTALFERQQTLDLRLAGCAEAEQRWQDQRGELENEIRRLTAQLRKTRCAA